MFLAVDMGALLLLGALARLMPRAGLLFLTTALGGFGVLLSLAAVLAAPAAAMPDVPVGPPGLLLHLALAPLPAFFLLLVFSAGTAAAGFRAVTAGDAPGIPLCLGGTVATLLAADGLTLSIGVGLLCFGHGIAGRARASLLIPLLLLVAVCLLTPAGFAPRFDAIRSAPAEADRATAAALLTITAVTLLICLPAPAARGNAVVTVSVAPVSAYILIRMIPDLCGPAVQSWCGLLLLLIGGGIAVLTARGAGMRPGLADAVADLARGPAGLILVAAGLGVIARAADLPRAQSLALEAMMLLAMAGAIAGTSATLAAEALETGAGTALLGRLGGLVHTMPVTSSALAAALFALSALPPGAGFAALWLLFQALLAAPHGTGLPGTVAVALAAAAIALAAGIGSSALVRIAGIALLGRPRTPRGAGAQDAPKPVLAIPGALAGLSLLAGVLPAAAIRGLAGAAIRDLTGAAPADIIGYAAPKIILLLAAVIAAVLFGLRWRGTGAKPSAPWSGGLKPPVGLPFGEPAAQSAGAGFLPELAAMPPLPRPPAIRLPAMPAAIGPWLILAAFAALLLALAITGA